VTFHRLREELLALFSLGVAEPLPDPAFNELALRVFRFQCEANPGYEGFVARRGLDPDGVSRWEGIPLLPARAFKSAPLVSGDPKEAERIFRTSGTTAGTQVRGEHHVRDLALYRGSLLPNFRAHLLPEGVPMPVLCLLPSPDAAPDSSLSFMMGEVVGAFGAREGATRDGEGPVSVGGDAAETPVGPGGGFFVHPERGIEIGPFREALETAVTGTGPVLLAGTAFAFVQWLEVVGKEGWRVPLPEGSRIMETGGYKGRTRAMSRAELYHSLSGAFGVPAERIVNEYGMTELLSQFYEPVMTLDDRVGESSGHGGRGDSRGATRLEVETALEPGLDGSTGGHPGCGPGSWIPLPWRRRRKERWASWHTWTWPIWDRWRQSSRRTWAGGSRGASTWWEGVGGQSPVAARWPWKTSLRHWGRGHESLAGMAPPARLSPGEPGDRDAP
jgi:hypothetical protein